MKHSIELFSIPNLLTAGNLISGILAVICAFSGRLEWSPWFIFLGAFFDFLDGFAARLLKKFSELGKQMDSLADMVTFGVAPGIVMMVVLTHVIYAFQSGDSLLDVKASIAYPIWSDAFFFENNVFFQGYLKYIPLAGLIIPFFSMFRLAKFNIDTRQNESFIGLPTPANAIFFMTFPLALYAGDEMGTWGLVLFHWPVLLGLIVVFSLLLVSELPLFSLKFKSIAWSQNKVRYLFLITCAILIPLFSVWSIALIVFLYLIFSLIVSVVDKKKEA